MIKKVAIVDESLKKCLTNYFVGKDVEIITAKNILCAGADILALYDYEGQIPDEVFDNTIVINMHPSLLPSFAEVNSLQIAYTSGVKVSGVTIHYVEKDCFYGKIIAQYPVLIGNASHFDEYTKEIDAVVEKLYPSVIESILKDKVFDFSDLFKSGCAKNCTSCNGCHK